MILLDTHIWIWWSQNHPSLPTTHKDYLAARESEGVGISAISCWELALLAARGRLQLPLPTLEWLTKALTRPSLQLLPLTPEIAVESIQLPGTFHRDPADRFIVATARVLDLPLFTVDSKILTYPHVRRGPVGAL